MLALCSPVAAGQDQLRGDTEENQPVRGLVFISIGLSLFPFGYLTAAKCWETADTETELSQKTLSNLFILGIAIMLGSVVLLIGGVGHFL